MTKCGNPGCKRDATYIIPDFGFHGLLSCAVHLGSRVRFVLEDRTTVCVERYFGPREEED